MDGGIRAVMRMVRIFGR